MDGNHSEKIMVSVCMITYGQEHYIEEAAKSILEQDVNFSLELIISNDKSPDNTDVIIKNLINNHPKGNLVRYFSQKKNLGVAKNLKFALEKCRGEFIAICEGDDFWIDKTKLKKQVKFLQNNLDYIVTYHDAKIVNSENDLISENKLPPNCRRDFDTQELKEGAFLLFLSLCFRNIMEFLPSEFENVDLPDIFLVSFLGNYGKGKFFPESNLSAYRKHDFGVWSSTSFFKKLIFRLNLYNNLFSFYSNKYDVQMSRYYLNRIRGTLRPIIFESAKRADVKLLIKYSKILIKLDRDIGIFKNIFFVIKAYAFFLSKKLKR